MLIKKLKIIGEYFKKICSPIHLFSLENNVQSKFVAGAFVHTKFKESSSQKWIIKENSDGSIILSPYE
jgi:hypothetical protein